MKKILLMCLGWAAATCAPAAEDRAFSLASAGGVDAALVERVRARMEAGSGVAVRLAPAVPLEEGQGLDAIGRTAAKTLAEGDPGIIVLARPAGDQPQGVCLPWERFAVLNLAKLEVGADSDTLERRAGQEGLRVMATLLGMSPCPFPLCVLVGYEKLEDLDIMSRNYCPPCQDRFTRLAREAGIRLIEPDVPAAGVPPEPAPPAEPVAEPVTEPAAEPAAAQ
jgi:hypothetical protein